MSVKFTAKLDSFAVNFYPEFIRWGDVFMKYKGNDIIKNCLLCENNCKHPCECSHCENYDNFRISEDGKALYAKIFEQGYQSKDDKEMKIVVNVSEDKELVSIYCTEENVEFKLYDYHECVICGDATEDEMDKEFEDDIKGLHQIYDADTYSFDE